MSQTEILERLKFKIDLSLCSDEAIFYSNGNICIEVYEHYAIVSIIDTVNDREIRIDVDIKLSEITFKLEDTIESLKSVAALLVGLLTLQENRK